MFFRCQPDGIHLYPSNSIGVIPWPVILENRCRAERFRMSLGVPVAVVKMHVTVILVSHHDPPFNHRLAEPCRQ